MNKNKYIIVNIIDHWIKAIFANNKKKIIFFVLIFLCFSLITISRRTDSVTNPQFWAEDGTNWYSNAYQMGPIKPFLLPSSGYFQTVSRLGAAISLLVSFQNAPLIFNLIAITIQILPALFLLSKRFEYIVSSFSMRFAIGLAYLLLPSSFETHINLSNSQWRLALLLFLIIIAKNSDLIRWKIFDCLFLILAGLSGPFSIVAFPIALFYYLKSKNRKPLYQLMLLGTVGSVQLVSSAVEIFNHARGKIFLGATFVNFFKILCGKVFIMGIIGSSVYRHIYKAAWWNQGIIPILLGFGGLTFLFYVLWKAELELKLFVIYAFTLFGLALLFPMVSSDNLPEWDAMLKINGGNRYFFLPMLAWVASVGWIYFRSKDFAIGKRIAAILLIFFIAVGIPLDWKFSDYKDFKFKEQAIKFEQLSSGENINIKINPGWKMNLVKK